MKDIRRGLWLIAFGVTLFAAAQMFAEDGDVRGGYFEYSWSQGKFRWEPFLKIPFDNGKMSENGESEIWGFRVWNLEPPKEDGKTYPVNVLESHFVPCDRKMHLVIITHPNDPDRKVERNVKCPENLW